VINQHKNVIDIKDIKVLYVEDDENIAEEVLEILSIHINNIHYAKDGQEGLELFNKHGIDLVISDIKMPNMDGIAMAQEIRKVDESVVILITSAFSDVAYFQKAIEIGVDNYLLKPIDVKKLLDVIYKSAKNILQRKQLNEYVIFSEMVMDTTANFIVLVSDGKVEYKNRSLLSKFNIDEISFKDFHISEYILNKDGTKKFTSEEDMLANLREDNLKQMIVYMYSDFNDLSKPLNAYQISDSYFESTNKHLIIFTDITQINEEKEKYEIGSIIDALTTLNNKFYFNKILSQMISEAKSDYRYKLSLIMFDIDFFKKVNDTYGHQVGDYVLKSLGDLIRKTLRSDDVVARWGGDEFTILCNVNGYSAEMLAQKLRRQIEAYKFETVGQITCSFGVSEYHKGDSEESFLERTDKALYMAKENGRNRVEVDLYSPQP